MVWADVVCFDKTGTLTQDRLVLAATEHDPRADRAALLARAASLAALSLHPLSRALVQSLPKQPVSWPWASVREQPGRGLEAVDAAGRRWRLGAPDWVGLPAAPVQRPVVAFAAVPPSPLDMLHFEFDEALRDGAPQTVDALRALGLAPRLLSGDGVDAVQALAQRVGIDQVQAAAAPETKLAALVELQAQGHGVMMVGDGINDGPVLARADVSFALSHGSALAQQRSDFIVLGSRLAELPATVALARRTMRVVHQNLLWAALYNAACVPLALMGYLPPWAAGAGMATSSLVVVMNALRLAR